MENNYDWTSFTVRVNIKNTTVAKVYDMWATINGMEQWFLKLCAYKKDDATWYSAFDKVEASAIFSWYWHGWPDTVVEKGKITAANSIDNLTFTFGQEGAENMQCQIKIFAEQDEIICELQQSNIPIDEKGKTYFHIGSLTGWTFYLTNLKSIVEGGIDLRNKNEAITKVITC
jgi:hypothetical protein